MTQLQSVGTMLDIDTDTESSHHRAGEYYDNDDGDYCDEPANHDDRDKEVLVSEEVVPVDHVEHVINRVILDLTQILANLKDTRQEAFPPQPPEPDNRFITQADLERALQVMKLQIVTEIR